MVSPALRELADKAGIVPGYHDIFGSWHEPSEPVLRALLHALGALPTPEADPAEALAGWQGREWRRVMPPVRVIFEDEPAPGVRLNLPASRLERPLRWRLLEEEGDCAEARFDPSQCEVLEEAELDGERYLACELGVAHGLAPGYHRLELYDGEERLGETTLICAPEACYLPPALAAASRVWGPAVQLYAVRSERNWGIGDFTDLKHLAEQWAERGAEIVGLNPLHALFLGNPAHASPYSPSSRRFLNPLYLDVEAVPEFGDCELARERVRSGEFQLRLQELREAALVDYPAVAAIKLGVLERLYRHFREQHLGEPGAEDGARGHTLREANGGAEDGAQGRALQQEAEATSRVRVRAPSALTARGRQFRTWQARHGPALRQYALFEAVYEHVRAADPNAWGWTQWPAELQDPGSPALVQFEREHERRVEFFEYLQWQAEAQLAAVAEHLETLGLAVGLYLDLAVSVDRGGADVWRRPGLYPAGVGVGAPPDDFNRQGQAWGLPPFNPRALREARYGPFIGALRASMAHAGALRIDHVMGLMRLYWIPHGVSAADGSYVRYAFDEMLGVVALESHRNRCLVIGEDLGTVPPELPAAMQRLDLLSYRLLFFEQDEHGLKPPAAWPAAALAAVSTHDLPTLAGYWAGHDLALRTELGLFGSDEARAAQVEGRARDRARLLLALEKEGLLPPELSADDPAAEMSEPLARALHRHLARTPALLMMVQPEDVLGMLEQVNLPGAPEARHPNWRRKLELPLERWPEHEGFLRLTADLAEERPRAAPKRPPPSGAQIPRATYRLQLHAGFGFRQAAERVPYLAGLGVSHVYCSPYLAARAGSSHGYDIIDHGALNPELGTQEDYQAFCAALDQHGMSQILDIVPNHMGVMGADNRWWLDVLEHGPASLYADYFDIDWQPPKPELKGRLLLPVLGGPYGQVLERGELAIRFEGGGFTVYYFEHRMPLDPASYPRLLAHRLEALALRLGAEDEALAELQSLMSAFSNLPDRERTDSASRLVRSRDARLARERLAALYEGSPAVRDHIEEALREFSGEPGEAVNFDMLHELLEAQAWRLAHWQAAADEINYRRFFDIHDLAALRVEAPGVFEATHQLVLRLLGEGRLAGLRVDHPDGLYDPEGYFRRLQEEAGAAPGEKAVYLLVEKILAADEPLPTHWPVHGTTGYEAMNQILGILIDRSGEPTLRRFYAAFSGERADFSEQLYKCKRLIMKYALASELGVLAAELNRISEADRHTRDFTLNRLRGALAEVVGELAVYRTYQREGKSSDCDRHYLEQAIDRARRESLAEETGIFDFLRAVLLGEGLSEVAAARAARFVMKLQQYTGAVMAKGMEDTAFYRYLPLVALNEVGGDPRRFGLDLADFHREVAARRERWPHALLATSTHDSKRSEDVRARLAVLSELPREWRARVRRWSELASPWRQDLGGAMAPSRNDEYLLYQTLLGVWPLETLDAAGRAALAERVEGYMLKALREAKRHTSWLNSDERYEAAALGMARSLIESEAFREDFLPFQRRVARLGLYNSLSQTLLKLTMPGVPDIYQGTELWDFSLVDPDNRRPVDYPRREAALAGLGDVRSEVLLDGLADGRAKLFLISRLLELRRRHEALFRDGDYLPLTSSGAKADHVCAFARRAEAVAIVIVPRFYSGLGEPPLGEAAWGDTRIELDDALSGADYSNPLSGAAVPVRTEAGSRSLRLAEALSDFPVAFLLG